MNGNKCFNKHILLTVFVTLPLQLQSTWDFLLVISILDALATVWAYFLMFIKFALSGRVLSLHCIIIRLSVLIFCFSSLSPFFQAWLKLYFFTFVLFLLCFLIYIAAFPPTPFRLHIKAIADGSATTSYILEAFMSFISCLYLSPSFACDNTHS